MSEGTAPPPAPAPAPEPPAPAAARAAQDARRVVIRSWPKTVFLYPLGLTAVACGGLSYMAIDPYLLGFVFAVMLLFNLVVISFEFRRHMPVVLLLLLLVIGLGAVVANQRWNVLGALGVLYGMVRIRAEPALYFAVASIYAAVLLAVLVASRFDYWEIRANEVLHHQGFLGDCERLPAAQLRIKKEVTDVFEFLLLGAGTLTIFPSRTERPIVIENVIGINGVEARIEDLLDSLEVKVEPAA